MMFGGFHGVGLRFDHADHALLGAFGVSVHTHNTQNTHKRRERYTVTHRHTDEKTSNHRQADNDNQIQREMRINET